MEIEKLQPGKFYHIYNRGNNREDIFIEDRNYGYFLRQYEKYISSVADTFAYCLLRNHFHLLVRIKISEANLDPSRQFSHLFNSYAKAINKFYERTGSLFQARFKRKEVQSLSDLKLMVHYIHHNPQKHKFVSDFRHYKHSSYEIIRTSKASFISVDEVLGWFGGREGYERYHVLGIGP